MKHRNLVLLVTVMLAPSLAFAGPLRVLKPVRQVQDRTEIQKELHAKGYKAKGGVERSKTDRDQSFPHFSSSFTYQGQTFPYTMVGSPPASGRTTHVRSVLIPLRVSFVYFEQGAVFDPAGAVANVVRSPLYQDAAFPNGVGQFGDMLQRATFWNRMDAQRRWHVLMDRPRVTPTVDIQIEPDIGELIQVGPNATDLLGNVRFGAMDAIIHTILEFMPVQPDELPIFVTYNVFADALGYHDAFQANDSAALQTLIYTSWLDEALVGDLLSDVSTFNHELGEWLNDPFVNNLVPTWEYPPSNVDCSFNPYLEVGDPQGNGPEYYVFPTVPIRLNGFTYHLQDLVMLPWFTGESPSSAQNGWYDFPATTQITRPFSPCTL